VLAHKLDGYSRCDKSRGGTILLPVKEEYKMSGVEPDLRMEFFFVFFLFFW